MGFEKSVNRLTNAGISAKGFTAADMVSMPNIRTEKPSSVVPMFFFLSVFANSRRTTPIAERIGTKPEGFISCKKILPPSMPARLSIHEVMVVPTFAPMITPTAWRSVISPEFTKPTTMTVVAEED